VVLEAFQALVKAITVATLCSALSLLLVAVVVEAIHNLQMPTVKTVVLAAVVVMQQITIL
jgi:hypothetical protein